MKNRFLHSSAAIILLATLWHTAISAQKTDCKYCDSLLSVSVLSDHDFESLSEALFNLNYLQSNQSFQLYRKGIDKALDQGKVTIAAELLTRLADNYNEVSQPDSASYYINSAVDIFKRIEDELGYARTANLRRILAVDDNDFLESLDISYEALEIFQKYDDRVGMAISYRDIGSVLLQQKKYEEGLDYCLRGVEYLEEVDFWYELQFTYQRIAIAYKNLGEFEKAHNYISKSINACRNLQFFRANQGLANKYWTVGYIYEGQTKLEEALTYYDSSKYYASLVGYSDIDRWIFNYKGGVYLKQEKYNEALTEFENVLEEIAQSKLETSAYDFYLPVYANLLDCYKGLGDYKKAVEVQGLITLAKDSAFVIESEKQALELRTKYETSQKEQRIITLQKDKKVQRRFLLLGGLLLLMLSLLAVFLMRSIRYRNRTNTLLQSQKYEIVKKSDHNEMLVKEIHHRVKNNLQILSSLLSLQSDAEDNEEVLGALQEGRNRVESMGMIHQRLYTKESMSSINMKEYIPDLCDYLKDLSITAERNIEIDSEVSIELVDVETAIPLGLIVNELITNSMKYAFDNSDKGFIKVKLWMNKEGKLCLHVYDDGDGKKAVISDLKSTHFGSKLVSILSKKLNGEIAIDSSHGYSTLIKFERYKLAV